MRRKIKTFFVFGYSIFPSNYGEDGKKSEFFFGQFSNLKRAFRIISGEGLHSYSMIAKRIKEDAIYSAFDLKVTINNKKYYCNRLAIKAVFMNDITFIDEPDLLRKEILKEFYYLDYGEPFSKGMFMISKGKVKRFDSPYDRR
ncbi:MAG: hypothetical protein WC879_17295 [Melioribacteraceae bacterium]